MAFELSGPRGDSRYCFCCWSVVLAGRVSGTGVWWLWLRSFVLVLVGEEIRRRVENSCGLESWATFLLDGVQRLG